MPSSIFSFISLGQLARRDVGPDQARRDAINTDAIGPELARHCLCKSQSPAFAAE